jgi:CheY-like chemotaxis protein
VAESGPPTALISAHARFREGLPRRGRELVDLVERVQRSDTLPSPRGARAVDGSLEEELGRRVHALYASAEVFQEEALTHAAREVARQLDAAREQRRKLSRAELGAVLALAEQLGATPERPAENDAPPRAIPIAETLAGTLGTPDVIAILLVGSSEVEAELRQALPAERCELTTSQEIDVAVEVIDSVAPDIVLVETALLEGLSASECLTAMTVLRGERSALSRALALIAEPGGDGDAELLARTRADAVLRLPLASATLLERLHHFARGGAPNRLGLEPLRGGTVEEIAAGVAEQVRRGILEALRTGREERIDLDEPADQAELLAATFSAVSRIRAHLSDLTDGRVRFDPRPAGGPAALALTDPQPAEPYVGLSDPLKGRRILVADDDPSVVWFFAGLLREAGALVVEASDGQAALELARRKPPDLVISDILMPGVDGFALCRELRRDLALANVPVILISWKEDFLQRMRELDAGAAGYLRKEAGSHQILSTVAQVLAPRSELEALLASGDEVRGRIDALGAERLLRTVSSQRPDARITLRDALNLFEIDVRAGNRLSITRTASDGTFARGRAALRQLVGVTTGRYTISTVETPIRGAFSEPLDKVLSDAVREMGALLDAVSDSFLLRVERVLLDDEVLSAMLAITPTELADVAARLRGAEPVSRLVLSGRWSARELEEHLRELVRRGAIVAVQGPANEDLAAEARAMRERDPSALLHASAAVRRSMAPPPTTLGDADVDWVDEDAALDAALAPSTAFDSDVPPDGEAEPVDQVSSDLSTLPTDPPELDEADESIDPKPLAQSADEEERGADGFAVRSQTLEASSARTAPEAPARGFGAVRFTWVLIAIIALGYVMWSAARPTREQAASDPKKLAPPAALPSAQPPTTPGSADAPRSGGASARHDGPQDDHRIAPPPPEAAGATPAIAAPAPNGVEFGRVLPFIDRSRGVDVAATQGLLVAELGASAAKAVPGAAAMRVRIDGKDRGTLPLSLALDAGRHELVLVRRDGTSFRYLMIRAGETRIVSIDP